MGKLRKMLALVLIGAIISVGGLGCEKKDKTPTKESLTKEAKEAESTAKEAVEEAAPAEEHPAGEHPK